MPDRTAAPRDARTGGRGRARTTVRARGLLVVALAALLAGTVGSVAPGPAGRVRAATAPKAVIIVGPVESQTAGYKASADKVAAAAAARGMDVRKVYTPNATWQNVLAQIQGATLVVYMGHGNGYPNPYPPGYLMPDRVDGFVLDRSSGTPCALSSTKAYCGEGPIGTYIDLKPHAVVLLEHLCYASGDSEPGAGKPALSVAKQRVDNYGAGFLRAGASAVFAYAVQDVSMVVNAIFQTHQTLDEVFMSTGFSGAMDLRFGSTRTGGAYAHMDPIDIGASDGDIYYRSAVGFLETTTDQVLGGPPPPPDPDRWAGADRYGTAAAISAASFAPGVPVAYVATGAAFPDALSGGAAAATKGGPVLLTWSDVLPSSTTAELTRLKPGRIVVLGGSSAVSDTVLAQLRSYTSGTVTRIAGTDRYATAAALSAATFAPGVPVAYVATGANFPDALGGAAAAGRLDAPVLLTATDHLPAVTITELQRLQPKRIAVLGGTSTVSAAVATALDAYTAGTVSRLAGPDRYATAVAISAATYAGAATVYIATGVNFPDGLAGAPLAGPLLLVPGTWVPDNVRAEVVRLKPSRIVLLGSNYTVSNAVEADLKEAAGLQ